MEKNLIELITQDRIEIPLSSLYQKIKRDKKRNAANISTSLKNNPFNGSRAYAFFEAEDKERARGVKEAVKEFTEEFPKYGAILNGKIAEKRVRSEEHVYFGMNPGCRLTAEDYIEVMESLGLSNNSARSLYPDLIDLSRKLSRAREEERSIIVGRYAVED